MSKNKKTKTLQEEKKSEDYYSRFGAAEYEIEAREEDLGRPLTQLEINAVRARRAGAPSVRTTAPERARLAKRREAGIDIDPHQSAEHRRHKRMKPISDRPVSPADEAAIEKVLATGRPAGDPGAYPVSRDLRVTSGKPQTPRLQIFKSEAGEYSITYGKTDPLGMRKELNSDLDSEIRRLFGYESWQEYKNHNMKDLKKSLQTDEKGKVVQGPTVHPFHVAYGLQEFVDNFDVNEYEIVGVPSEMRNIEISPQTPDVAPAEAAEAKPDPEEFKRKAEAAAAAAAAEGAGIDEELIREDLADNITKSIAAAREKHKGAGEHDPSKLLTVLEIVLKMRQNFFGDSAAEGGLARDGILHTAMLNPQEKLLNKDVIRRVKEKFDFNQIFNKKFTGNLPISHPAGKYWKADVSSYNDVTDELKKILKVSVKNAMRTSHLLKEAEEGQYEDAGTWVEAKIGDYFDDSTMVWFHGVWTAAQVADPTPVTAIPDIVLMTNNVYHKPTSENWKALGFSFVAAIPYIGDAYKIGTKGKKIFDGAEGIAKALKKAGGEHAQGADELLNAIKLLRENPNPSTKEVEALIKQIEEASAKMKHGRTIPDSTTRAADQLDEMASGLKGFKKGRGEVTIKGKKYQAGVAGVQTVGELGGAYVQLEPLDEPSSMMPTSTHNVGLSAEELPDIPISLERFNFYIVPKNWRSLDYLTPTEHVLSQRVGANTNFFKNQRSMQLTSADSKAHYLIFGHSQSGPTAMGGAIINQIEAAEAKFKRYTHGVNDINLAKKIKKVKNENFTHAFLFLGGNTENASPAYDFKDAKSAIIRHVTDVLNISKENIVVILPPVNRDNKFSKSRYPMHQRAEKYFNSLGVKVLGQVVGDKKDFRDGIHIKNDSLARRASNNVLGLFPKAEAANIAAPAQEDKETIEKPPENKLSRKQIAKIVVDEATKSGIDPLAALTAALIEGYNPSDDKGGHYGLFQLSPGEAKKYGLKGNEIYDVRKNSKVHMKMAKGHLRFLQKNDLPATGAMMWLTHNQGRVGILNIYTAAKRGQNEITGEGLVGRWVERNLKTPEAREKYASRFCGRMVSNYYGPNKSNACDPREWLRDWTARNYPNFEKRARKLLSSIEAEVVSESKFLEQLINIIERVEENELV